MEIEMRIVRTENLLQSRQSNSKVPAARKRSGVVMKGVWPAMHEQSYHTHVSCESSREYRANALGFFACQMGGFA